MRTPRPWPATLIVAATALALLIAVASVLTRAARPGAERIVLYAGLAARTPVVLAIYTGRLLCLAAGAQAKRRTTRGRGVKGGGMEFRRRLVGQGKPAKGRDGGYIQRPRPSAFFRDAALGRSVEGG